MTKKPNEEKKVRSGRVATTSRQTRPSTARKPAAKPAAPRSNYKKQLEKTQGDLASAKREKAAAVANAIDARSDLAKIQHRATAYRTTHSIHNLVAFVGFVVAVAAFCWALAR